MGIAPGTTFLAPYNRSHSPDDDNDDLHLRRARHDWDLEGLKLIILSEFLNIFSFQYFFLCCGRGLIIFSFSKTYRYCGYSWKLLVLNIFSFQKILSSIFLSILWIQLGHLARHQLQCFPHLVPNLTKHIC